MFDVTIEVLIAHSMPNGDLLKSFDKTLSPERQGRLRLDPGRETQMTSAVISSCGSARPR
jgi:hypothetical protein